MRRRAVSSSSDKQETNTSCLAFYQLHGWNYSTVGLCVEAANLPRRNVVICGFTTLPVLLFIEGILRNMAIFVGDQVLLASEIDH
jgi:hypothetical protein